ncbi:MAG: hypothetical protein U5K31_10450 [Balneolaceae bacterium]|nr:hypothetical protein [Balneolaceae bacterium]
MGNQEETPGQAVASQQEIGSQTAEKQASGQPENGDSPYSLNRLGRELVSDVINVDSGLPGTLYDLFKMPGVVVSSYFEEPGRYMKPFRYALFLGGFYVLLATGWLDMQHILREAFSQIGNDAMRNDMPGEVKTFLDNVQRLGILLSTKYLSLNLIFLMAPSLAVTSYLMFRGTKRKFVQHAVLNLYSSAQIILFSLAPLIALMAGGGRSATSDYMGYAFTAIGMVYFIWVYKNFFGLRYSEDYAKCVLSLILGYLLYFIVLTLLQVGGAAIWQFVL